ncbi:MAG: hypothetical protein A2Y64_08235 [Candidatus Coatesbacteria bacterium RBG_13_66_14]|uniref:Uncharacterized protein n=1 Tax=Candidatus Coatesbacteria bacterium RBG_13_66_14 TaxID=1817816 RepID=A0A1F5EXL2_9BACT|nr:MAG: hypothetical protein A2Y64_08235 [Candidatus Coatesbacteria bacterium RBG_13_66_14]
MLFNGQQVITLLFLGAFLGLVTGLGWDLAKGKAALFWAGFLAACAAVTAFYHFTAPAEVRETRDILDQGLTLVASYLPVVAVIWWRHRPRGGGPDSAPPREGAV